MVGLESAATIVVVWGLWLIALSVYTPVSQRYYLVFELPNVNEAPEETQPLDWDHSAELEPEFQTGRNIR